VTPLRPTISGPLAGADLEHRTPAPDPIANRAPVRAIARRPRPSGSRAVVACAAWAFALALGGATAAHGQIVDDPCQNPPAAPDADGDGIGDARDLCPAD